MNGTGWTIERTDLLRQLWAQGLSASQIAAQLGGISRSGVIGKAYRLDLPSREKKYSPELRAAIAVVKAARKPRIRQRRRWLLPQPPTETLTTESPPKPVKGITLLELKESTCRWPLWGQDRREGLYCGGKTVPGHVWCPGHCCLAYRPPDSRSRAA